MTTDTVSVNQALRAACGAAKMLARSELVECPYEIDATLFMGQCDAPVEGKRYANTSAMEQFYRICVFLRAIQQGIVPPTNIYRLPDDEHNQLLNEFFTLVNEYKASGAGKFETFICNRFFRVNPSTFANIERLFSKYIDADGQGSLLRAYDCEKKNDLFENQLMRVFSIMKDGPDYLQQFLENSTYGSVEVAASLAEKKGFNSVLPIEVSVTNKLDKLNIFILTEEKRSRIYQDDADGKYIAKSLMYDDSNIPLENIYTIVIKDKQVIQIPGLAILDISKQSVVQYVFDKNVVVDVHPYLMYLLQIDPWASKTFMARSFGGNMIPPAQYPLAYYIIAHYVANRPPYKNSAEFYNKPIKPNNEKLPEMVAALRSNSAELKQRIVDGYAWLKEPVPNTTELIKWLGGGIRSVFEYKARKAAGKFASMFTTRKQGQGGGKRVTRKNRIAHL